MYYFAYGSNMSHALFFARCPGATFTGAARLRDYWLIFDGMAISKHGATANITRSLDDVVWGGVYEITEEHLKTLDAFEGYPHSFTRSLMEIDRAKTHEKVQAWVYWREEESTGIPSHDYLATILQGAHDCHLPLDYIADSLEIEPRH